MWKEQRNRAVAVATWDNPPNGFNNLDGVALDLALVSSIRIPRSRSDS